MLTLAKITKNTRLMSKIHISQPLLVNAKVNVKNVRTHKLKVMSFNFELLRPSYQIRPVKSSEMEDC